jgi:hypothetical protein
MINEILQAVIDECNALFLNTGGTVIFKTDFKSDSLVTYTMPLLIVDVVDAPDSGQQIGGLTRVDWMFAMNSYNYMPNSQIIDDKGYSTSLLKPIDTIRQHFSNGVWLTSGMTDILNNYGFKFALSGITGADALEQDGIILGYKIMFDSLAFDSDTLDTIDSTEELETIIDETMGGYDQIFGEPETEPLIADSNFV